MRKKVTVIGAGHVGEVTAMRIAEKGLADVVLLDIQDDMPVGKGLDIKQSAPVEHFDAHIFGTNNYKDTKGSDVVVITAGIPRKPGMSRDDLLKVNADVVGSVTEKVVKNSPDCIIITVTNPLDVMTYLTWKKSGFQKNRVVGMAGILDTARFRAFISMELNVSVENIQTLILGGHGDTMVPLPRYTTISGIPISELLPKAKIDAMVDRAAKGGGEIVALLKTGSAYYAPASGAVEMVDSILNDRKKILPCCALCNGEYGVKGIYFGVPVVLGSKGIEKIIELKLNKSEQALVDKSAAAVKEVVDAMKKLVKL